MTERILFWLGLLIAILAGNLIVTQSSSISSDDPLPNVVTELSWQCLPDYDETCFIVISEERWRTGP